MAQEYKFKVGDKVLFKTTLLNDNPRPVYKIRAVTEDGRYLIVNEKQNDSLGWFRDDELEPYAEPKKDKDMIVQEDYCSFETSKLLKEKGFKQEGCHKSYSMEGPVAPTHQMAMKWLREEKGIYVYVEPYMVGGTYIEELKVRYCGRILDTNRRRLYSIENMTSYTEAIEERIEYTLENLI